jgi:squalene synthase HpnC
MVERDARLLAAYESCARTAQAHYENFPVASVLVPKAMRPHVAAVYAFARTADDFADEGVRASDDRIRLLDGWLARVRLAAQGREQDRVAGPGEPDDTQQIFLAVADTIQRKRLPVSLFEDLLSAFRQDVTTTRYESWDDLLDYCRRSANPVGRLVLRIADVEDDRLDAMSDAICTALQLTNFWQDLKIDFDRGRIYLPQSEMRAHGAEPDALARGDVSAGWRRALDEAIRRTRALFTAGRPLCDAVSGRLRYELRGTWLGGTRILDRLERAGGDVVRHRPSLGAGDAAWFAWHMTTWARR